MHELQEHLSQTHLFVIDEISMVGRQMMARIDSRCEQAIPSARNPAGHSLAGMSLVCVGDPAQCQAIGDQQMYDVEPHERTRSDPHAQAVRFSNKGREIYGEFDHVIVLQTTHRLDQIEEPATEADHAYNQRADRFLAVLNRARNLTLTVEDY